MNARPRVKIELTTADKLVEIVGWLAIVAIWVLAVVNYFSLPDIIPTHYNGAGQADGFGGKVTILTLPFVATILFVGLAVLNNYPHIFNYPTIITPDNALQQYTSATRLIRYLKLSLAIVFGLLIFRTIQHTNGQADGLGVWFLPLALGLIFIPLIVFMVKSVKTTQ